jgi:hypothetical protein
MKKIRECLDMTTAELYDEMVPKPGTAFGATLVTSTPLVGPAEVPQAPKLVPGIDYQTAEGLCQFEEGSEYRVSFTDLPNALLQAIKVSEEKTPDEKKIKFMRKKAL